MDNVQKVLDLIQNDEELQQELMKCNNKNSALEAVKRRAPEVTPEEIQQAVKQIIAKLNEMQANYLKEEEKGVLKAKNGDTVTTATTVTTITAAASSYAFI